MAKKMEVNFVTKSQVITSVFNNVLTAVMLLRAY